jgi:putative DNA primase/helicase
MSPSQVAPSPVEWLWEPYLARGKLAVLDGDPGVGKSFLALDLAARLSRGGPLPDGPSLGRPHATLFLGGEDDVAHTLRPRADAAGADLGRLVFLVPRGLALPRLPDHLPALEEAIRVHQIGFVVIDPLAAFVPPGPSGGKDRPVRRTLDGLAELAARYGCAVLLVRHLTKSGGLRWLYRGLGSLGVVRAIHTGLLVARHPTDPEQRVLARTKPTDGPPAPSLGFWLLPGGGRQPRIHWLGPVSLTADELYTTREPESQRPRERAAEWLRRELADGARRAAELFAGAAAAGITRRTLKRAKKDLGVESEQVGKDGTTEWCWSNPEAAPWPTRGDDLAP